MNNGEQGRLRSCIGGVRHRIRVCSMSWSILCGRFKLMDEIGGEGVDKVAGLHITTWMDRRNPST